MLIQSAQIESFGTIGERIDLAFGPGLNIIYGPNETGKSTVMRAIWFALTRRAQSQAQDIKDIQPSRGGVPRVSVRLKIGDERYEMTKVFDGKSGGKAHLRQVSSSGQVREFQDDEADKVLRQALGFSEDTDRSKTPSHFGLWPLTWVEQGQDQRDPGIHLQDDGADERLTKTLSQLTGEALAGDEGRQIMVAAKEEYEKYYTASGSYTTKAGAPRHEAEQAFESARAKEERLQQQVNDYEHDLKRYSRLEKRIDEIEEVTLPGLRQELGEIESQVRKVEQLQNERQTVKASKQAADGAVDKWVRLGKQRQELRQKIGAAKASIAESKEEAQKLRAEREELQGRHGDLVAGKEKADGQRQEAKKQAKLLEAQLDVIRLADTLSRDEERLETVEAHHRELIEWRAQLEGLKIGEADVDKVQRLQRRVDDRQTELRAASARLELKALAETTVTIGGETIDLAASERHEQVVQEAMTLKVGQLLEIGLQPGGQNLGDLRKALDKARQELAQNLERLGIESWAQAQSQWKQRQSLEQKVAAKKTLVNDLAKEGLEGLRQSVKSLSLRRQKAHDVVLDIADGERELPDDEEACRQALSEARKAQDEAQRDYEEAQRKLEAHNQRAQDLSHKVDLAAQRQKNEADNLAAATEELAQSVAADGDEEQLQAQLEAAKQDRKKWAEKLGKSTAI